MIYVNLSGGLGNQMFQYAIAKQYQFVTNQEICLNLYEYQSGNIRSYELDQLNIDKNVRITNRKPKWYLNDKNYFNKMFRKSNDIEYMKFCAKFYNALVWYPEYKIDLPPIDLKKDIYISGYWQCKDYFADVENILKKEFLPKITVTKLNEDFLNKICNSESICVAVRRGDYVNNKKIKKLYYVCDIPYYVKGIEYIKSIKPNAVVFVFSNDINWVKENIPISGEVYYENVNNTSCETLKLMLSCKNFVISNSSFNWWAQYLSSNKEKIVCAPSRWYTNGRKCDIFEPFWHLVEV